MLISSKNYMKKLISKFSLNNLKIWQLILPLLAVANSAYFLNNYLGSLLTLSFFLFAPGYLFLKLITDEVKSKWETISFSLGLSLLSIMLGGLVLNTLNLIGLEKPLTTQNIFVMLNIITLLPLLFSKNKDVQIPKTNFKFSPEKIAVTGLLTILPFLAAGGAISLNNSGPNTLTLALFGIIPVLFLWLIIRRGLRSLYPYAVLTMGMAILFTSSLRGWHITGHDIQHEFAVFQNTYKDSLWHVRVGTGDPYNACLSITILPTIIAKVTSIPAVYVFKLIFQIIFAFGLLPVYLFLKKFSNEIYALIGAFIFITFPTFLNDMPFLNRQEIAFVYFGLLVLTTFSDALKKRSKIILSIGLLVGIMLSHYSSNYITLGLLTSAYLIYSILKRIQVIKIPFEIPVLSLPIIIGAFFFTFLWNSQITASASNLESSVIQTIKDFQYKRSVKTRFLSYGLIEQTAVDLRKEFEDFAKNNNSPARYVAPENLPLTNLGHEISRFINVKSFNDGFHALIAKAYQLLIVIGSIIYLIRQRKLSRKKETYYFALIASTLALLVVFTLFPRLASDYSIIRLLQQTLILTALPMIIAGEFIFAFLKRFKVYAIVILFSLFFLHSSGLIPQITGGYKPQLSLNNAGGYYSYFYTHESDLLATGWLANNKNKELPVFHDVTSDTTSVGYYRQAGLIRSDETALKEMESGYIYQGFVNVTKGMLRTFQVGDFTEYEDPYITDNRPLIYSNKESQVYGKSEKK